MCKKICYRCSIEKDVTEFFKCGKCKDGYKATCKLCLKNDNDIRWKNYYNKNSEALKEKSKNYREENKTKVNEREKEYYLNNKEKILIKNLNYYHNKKNNPNFKLKKNIRSLIYVSLKNKGTRKNSKTSNILGCTFDEFKLHIESLWEPWMNWDNYGNPKDSIVEPNKTWDIDHIIPNSSATTEEELLKLNHFSNLQPLCSYHNRYVKRG